ncbi:Ion-translocating oxidoreductase complex subunit D [Pseudoalteromonas sp. CIP111854]|uniref:Ion-translocating oxidoreductase complex subunit D n=1 Tax=Pseudoalteromonas holothuriae TaxID=2963714 RepID=A0A9W4VMH6_9GAMM|nr:electron transport complex subunit RsxD [Pseudoalteromonas sp. CIP111854]CAH9050069.1 Ion-translocating oxidoreductase complex subunit D [Pseudoalteromonas sp. CIP111854]
MKLTMASSPHNHNHKNVSKLMLTVAACCIPGIIVQCYFFGFGVIVQLLIALVTASLSEACMLKIRNRPIWPTLSDGSAWLTAVLLAISIPPLAPWWIIVIGTLFAIAMVKQLYGGLGFNLFNPAMAAYVLLLISFPVQMTSWTMPSELIAQPIGLIDTLSLIFLEANTAKQSLISAMVTVDGTTMATPLDTVKTAVSQNLTVTEAMSGKQFDELAGIGWAWVNIAYLVGGIFLLKAKVINWHIPLAMLGSLALCAAIGFIIAPGSQAGSVFHLLSGATMLGAFFIATDPVSASTTNHGRLIYGACIGLLVYLIRSFGGYPDAVAFAVLIMNMTVPLIDHYTQPRTYGHGATK